MVQQTWGDRFDSQRHFTITFLLPQPAREQGDATEDLPHVLTEQHPRTRQIGILISILKTRRDVIEVTNTAYSIPAITARQGFLQWAGVDHLCRTNYQCEVWHGNTQVRTSETDPRPTGQVISVYLVELPTAKNRRIYQLHWAKAPGHL